MDKINKRLSKLTRDILGIASDTDSVPERYERYNAELTLVKELSKTWKLYEGLEVALPDTDLKERLDELTVTILAMRDPAKELSENYTERLKMLQNIIKTWDGFDGVEITLKSDEDEKERNRKSAKTWDSPDSALVTEFKHPNKLTARQQQAFELLDDNVHNRVLLMGGSGSGKSFVEAYKIVRDVLRHKAPCLIARYAMVDLVQGMIDQIIPSILQLIAVANGQEDWKTWKIDGLAFAKWTDKKTKLEFATGGYIRFAGLSARDLSESGSDKILSPSWFHIMVEESSEVDYETVELLFTRLRHVVHGHMNKFMLCENPPSINQWTYKYFTEFKREDGSPLGEKERERYGKLLMNPHDNEENLSAEYLEMLSQLTGANRERFYLGAYQDTETGEILKKMTWTDNMPRSFDWDKLIIYTDPTPLTGKEHSKWADYKASVLCGLFGGETYVIDVRLVRGSTMDMLMNIKQLWDVSPNQSITEIWMEKKGVPSDFKQVLLTFNTMTNANLAIQMDARHFGDKKQAIEIFLQPLFENELIFFNAAFRDTERGKQTQFQILKFSRKSNKNVHDDIPDAIMKADTKMKGKQKRKRNTGRQNLVSFVKPAYVHN